MTIKAYSIFDSKLIFFFIGASSGIGRELAKQLARLSPTTRLVLSARREQELQTLADELNLDFEHCLVLPLDLELQYDCFKSKVDLVLERFGQIDVLINSAGISQQSFIRDTIYKIDSRLMNINYLGTITLSKTVLQVNQYCFLVVYIEYENLFF
jgi:short-subunit dehydrogenase